MKTATERNTLCRESHRRQVTNAENRFDILEDLAVREDIEVIDQEAIEDILSEPDADCDCGFCRTHDWEALWRQDPVYSAGLAFAGYHE